MATFQQHNTQYTQAIDADTVLSSIDYSILAETLLKTKAVPRMTDFENKTEQFERKSHERISETTVVVTNGAGNT
jgi:hypothetical protein